MIPFHSMVQYDTSCAYDFKPNIWKRHTGWSLVRKEHRPLWLRPVEEHTAATATTAGTLKPEQGDPRLDEYG